MSAFFAGAVAGYGIAMPVGAIAVLIVSLTARTSLRVGAAAGLGAATADGIYALAAVLGGAALAGVVAPAAAALRAAATVLLVAMAGHTAFAAIRRHRAPDAPTRDAMTPPRAYAMVLVLTLLNPVTVVYFAALVLGRGDGGGGWPFVLGAFLASGSWQLLVAGGGSVIGGFLTSPRGRLITALVSSAVIAVMAIRVLYSQ